MKLRTGVLKKLKNDSEKISFWIDYLRLKIDDVECRLISINKNLKKLIDFDNSNYIVFDEFGFDLTAQKIKLSNWDWLIYSYSYFWVSIPLFIIIEYWTQYKEMFNCWWKIDFYGQYFRLLELWEFESNFVFGEIINNNEITRIDYRIDFFNFKDKVISSDIIDSRSNARFQSYKTQGFINSWKFWNSTNKTVVVRWYDKKLDISKKWKFRLYWDYLNFNNVFRLEWEFLNSFCKGFSLQNLWDLVDKCRSYIWIDINDKNIKYFTSYVKLDLSNEFARTKYCRVMSSYIREALKNGVNVYDYVDEELIKIWLDKTKIYNIKNGLEKINNYY